MYLSPHVRQTVTYESTTPAGPWGLATSSVPKSTATVSAGPTVVFAMHVNVFNSITPVTSKSGAQSFGLTGSAPGTAASANHNSWDFQLCGISWRRFFEAPVGWCNSFSSLMCRDCGYWLCCWLLVYVEEAEEEKIFKTAFYRETRVYNWSTWGWRHNYGNAWGG